MRVWDVRRAVAAMRSVDSMGDVPLWLQSEREMAGVALYASLFEKDIARLDLWGLPASHREGATFLNVMRFLDMPQAVAMALERSQVRIYQEGEGNWEYAHGVAKLIKSDPKQLQIRAVRR
jgi:hypothetical protein